MFHNFSAGFTFGPSHSQKIKCGNF